MRTWTPVVVSLKEVSARQYPGHQLVRTCSSTWPIIAVKTRHPLVRQFESGHMAERAMTILPAAPSILINSSWNSNNSSCSKTYSNSNSNSSSSSSSSSKTSSNSSSSNNSSSSSSNSVPAIENVRKFFTKMEGLVAEAQRPGTISSHFGSIEGYSLASLNNISKYF